MTPEEKINELENKIMDLEKRIGSASILLCDYDGYFNPVTKQGDARELALLIDEAYIILQGDHWLWKKGHEPLPEEHHDIDD